MKTLLAISAILVTTLAAPLEIISSRPLTSREESRLSPHGFSKLSSRSPTLKSLLTPSCPKNGYLPPASYLSPTLIVPISRLLPDLALGPTKNPKITPNDICSIFNLFIPASALDKTCTLEFLFPSFPSQTLSPYAYVGGGHFTFTGYAFDTGATAKTTYNAQPELGPSPPQPPAVLSPGNAYVINVGPCGLQPGQKGMTVSGKLCSPDTTFVFRQGEETCPIGFFVVIS